MKTKIFYFIISTLLLTNIFTSCENDKDTTPPVIELISPAENQSLLIGNTHGIHLDMNLSDNEMLASYKIEIHNNFDGHEHSRNGQNGMENEPIPFFFSKSWNLTGLRNTNIHHHEIVIPANTIAGKYHMIIHCTDAAGNESHIARNIILSNDGDDQSHI